MSNRSMPAAERRERLEAVKRAVLLLSDGSAHATRECFDGQVANWHANSLRRLSGFGLIERVGSGIASRWVAIEGADLAPYLEDENAARLLWDTGIEALKERPVDIPEDLLDVGDLEVVDEEPPAKDPTHDLLERLLGALERIDDRLTALEEKGNAPTEQADEIATNVVEALVSLEVRLEKRIEETRGELQASIAHLVATAHDHTAAIIKASNVHDDELMKQIGTDVSSAISKLGTDMQKEMAKAMIPVMEHFDKRADKEFEANQMIANSMVEVLGVIRRLVGEHDDPPSAPLSERPSALSVLMAGPRHGPVRFKKGPRT